MPCTFTYVQRLKPSSSQTTGLGLSFLACSLMRADPSRRDGQSQQQGHKGDGRAPYQSSLFWRGRGQTMRNCLFVRGPDGNSSSDCIPSCVFLLHIDCNSVDNSGVAVLYMPCWMSQTQFGSAPENLKELYQTVMVYFKAANTMKVFLLALQLVGLYLKY